MLTLACPLLWFQLQWNAAEIAIFNMSAAIAFSECIKRNQQEKMGLPVDAIAFTSGRWPVIKDMTEVRIASSTQDFLAWHENDREIQFWFDIVPYGLIVWWPPSSTIKLCIWSERNSNHTRQFEDRKESYRGQWRWWWKKRANSLK